MANNSISGPAVERVNVLGVGISILNLESARRIMEETVDAGRKGYIAVTGVHGVSEAQENPDFRRILNDAFLCTPDGMPMVWMCKWAGHSHVNRVYGPDLMELVCQGGIAKERRHFLYGGGNGVAEKLKANLETKFPGINVVGTYTPPFRALNSEEERALQELVARTKPDYFWVGLSTPKQERFMAAYLPKLDALIMIGVGAAFDFHAGTLKQAPRWMMRWGLEWAYRLYREPKRLWRRYAKNNPLFIARVFLQKTGLRKYSFD
jgi:N-acetylglucosaminyldiphosphoundecaprenol N-acetyl-beta-D-mannosaminyltransferase